MLWPEDDLNATPRRTRKNLDSVIEGVKGMERDISQMATERGGKPEEAGKLGKPEKLDKGEKMERPERVEHPGRPGR